MRPIVSTESIVLCTCMQKAFLVFGLKAKCSWITWIGPWWPKSLFGFRVGANLFFDFWIFESHVMHLIELAVTTVLCNRIWHAFLGFWHLITTFLFVFWIFCWKSVISFESRLSCPIITWIWRSGAFTASSLLPPGDLGLLNWVGPFSHVWGFTFGWNKTSFMGVATWCGQFGIYSYEEPRNIDGLWLRAAAWEPLDTSYGTKEQSPECFRIGLHRSNFESGTSAWTKQADDKSNNRETNACMVRMQPFMGRILESAALYSQWRGLLLSASTAVSLLAVRVVCNSVCILENKLCIWLMIVLLPSAMSPLMLVNSALVSVRKSWTAFWTSWTSFWTYSTVAARVSTLMSHSFIRSWIIFVSLSSKSAFRSCLMWSIRDVTVVGVVTSPTDSSGHMLGQKLAPIWTVDTGVSELLAEVWLLAGITAT